MKKKKIAILHPQVPFTSGGAENLSNSLVMQLRKRDYEAELVTLPFKWYPENTLYDNLLMWRLTDLNYAAGGKIDLVIGTKFPSYGAVHENKVVWLVHQYRQAYDLYQSDYGCRMEKNGEIIRRTIINYDNLTIPEAKLKYAISKNVANRLKKFNNIDAKPLYPPPALIERYACNNFSDYILSVGRLDKLKRTDLLIKAIPYCNKNLKVKIAGIGPEEKSLKELAEKLKVQDRVEFLGFVSDEDLIQLYSNAFAVFYAPIDEDYGYTTIEAYLSKKPVVTCYDSGGVLEFVDNENTGFVTDPEPESISKSINNLHNNVSLCMDMGCRGYENVKEINWDFVIENLTMTIR